MPCDGPTHGRWALTSAARIKGGFETKRSTAEHGDSIRDAEKQAYMSLIGEVAPLEGARVLILDLRERDHTVVLASSAKPDEVEHCKAAKRAKVPTLGVLTGGFSREELEEAGAAAVFRSIVELRADLDSTPLG